MVWLTKSKFISLYFLFFALALALFHSLFGGFFPNHNGGLGHDYKYFFPALLDGFFWFKQNGLFSIQWFTAGFCGGMPALANPQNMYFSLPQMLTFFVNPLMATYIAFICFAVLGLAGTYLLVKRRFHTSASAAGLASVLFMMNGFYVYHMIIGHLSFHAIMTTPLLAYLLLSSGSDRLAKLAFASLILGYSISSGMFALIPIQMLCVLLVGMLYGMQYGRFKSFMTGLLVICALAVLLNGFQLYPMLSFISYFPRDYYTIPGFSDLGPLLVSVLQNLFLGGTVPPTDDFINVTFRFQRHEWEFGITLIPAMVLFAFCMIRGREFVKRVGANRTWQFYLLGIGILLLLPALFNLHATWWHDILKSLPIIKNSSSLLRWFFVYSFILILLAAIAFDEIISDAKLRRIALAIAFLAIIVQNVLTDQQYYHQQSYDPHEMIRLYTEKSKAGSHHGIAYVVEGSISVNDENRIFRGNEVLAIGASQIQCYEPLFGYRLETFPRGELKTGPVNLQHGDKFNLKNPVCYVFPSENQCKPGDHFNVEQLEQLRKLINYEPYEFTKPNGQRIFEFISVITAFLLLVAIISPLRNLKRRQSDT